MIQPLFNGLASAINKALETDPATLAKLARLDGQVYAIHCTLPPLSLNFRLNAEGVEIMSSDEAAQVTLRGTALALVRLLAEAAQETGAMSQSNVEISGDATALLQLSRTFSELEIDWEELLSKLVGDVAARGITQTIQMSRDWETRNRPRHISTIREFAHQQLGLVPIDRIKALNERSRELQYRLDRLEARLNLRQPRGLARAD